MFVCQHYLRMLSVCGNAYSTKDRKKRRTSSQRSQSRSKHKSLYIVSFFLISLFLIGYVWTQVLGTYSLICREYLQLLNVFIYKCWYLFPFINYFSLQWDLRDIPGEDYHSAIAGPVETNPAACPDHPMSTLVTTTYYSHCYFNFRDLALSLLGYPRDELWHEAEIQRCQMRVWRRLRIWCYGFNSHQDW